MEAGSQYHAGPPNHHWASAVPSAFTSSREPGGAGVSGGASGDSAPRDNRAPPRLPVQPFPRPKLMTLSEPNAPTGRSHHGARWWERPVGALGSLSVMSFGRGKGWTGSRGGALLSRGAESPEAPPLTPAPPGSRDEVKALGTALAQWWLGGPAWYWLPASIPGLGLGETRYRAPADPAGMTRGAAAMIQESRPLATTEMFARRSNAWELLARLPFSD